MTESVDFTGWPEVGRGDERICYQNPDDPSRCIKVSPKHRCKQSRREIRYFRYLSRRKLLSWSHIPAFYGVVETDALIGIEQELIRDADGGRPLDVRHYLKQPLTQAQQQAFWQELAELKRYLLDNHVIPCDLVMSNLLVVERDRGVRIMLVDGLGGAEIVPFSDYIRCLGRRKVHRKWKKFIDKTVLPHFEAFQGVDN